VGMKTALVIDKGGGVLNQGFVFWLIYKSSRLSSAGSLDRCRLDFLDRLQF
jgi:hypothetical protein